VSLYDRLHVFTTSPGTGNYSITGVAANRLSIDEVLDAEGITKAGALLELWVLPDDSAGSNDFEHGLYTYDGTSQLARTAIIRSSNSNAAVNWGATQRNIVSFPSAALLRRLFNDIFLGALAGTANARAAATQKFPVPALYDGLTCWGVIPEKNTGAMTFTPNSGVIPAKNVYLGGAALQDNDAPANTLVGFRYSLADDVWNLLQGEAVTAFFTSLRIQRGALNESLGATVSAAATVNIWTPLTPSSAFGNAIPLAGPGTITSFGTAPQAGAARELLVMSTLTLANGANLVLPGGVNFVASAGDRLRVRAETTTKFHVAIDRADGTPPVNTTTRNGFSAHKNGTNQGSISSGTPAKLTFGTEEWDTGGVFDTTNSRFTPGSGKWSVNATVSLTGGLDGLRLRLQLYKNGSLFKSGPRFLTGSGNEAAASFDVLIAGNGTDYFEVYLSIEGGGTYTVDGVATLTYFQATKVSD